MPDKRRARRGPSTVIAGIFGAMTFLAFLFVLSTGPVIAVISAVVAFGAGWLLTNERKTMEVKVDGVTHESLEAALAQGEAKLADFRAIAQRVESKPVKVKADQIAALVRKILETIEADPEDLKPARSFLGYYLDASINILRKYVEILERGSSAAEVRASVAKVEPMLETIRAAFEKQLARLLENDMMNLDTEIAVLEKTIKMEGLGQQ